MYLYNIVLVLNTTQCMLLLISQSVQISLQNYLCNHSTALVNTPLLKLPQMVAINSLSTELMIPNTLS